MSKFLTALFAALSAFSTCVVAAPVTFSFAMPAWTNSTDTSKFGTSSVLEVTLNNGSSSIINQTYLNSQVTSATVTSVGGTFQHTWSGNNAYAGGVNGVGDSYISTDAAGVPTLDLLPDVNSSFYIFPESSTGVWLQWGIIHPTLGGAATFAVVDYSTTPTSSASSSPWTNGVFLGFRIQGEVVQGNTVPEPTSVALFIFGLTALVVSRKRNLIR